MLRPNPCSRVRFIGAETATLIGAGLSAAASGASAINAGKMNKRGAKTAKQMQQIGNEFSAAEAQKARDWAVEQSDIAYQRELEASDPSFKRERLEQAGFNPYFGLDGDTGISTSASSGAAATGSSGSQPNQVDPGPSIQSIGLNVRDALNSYFSNRKLVSEATNQDINNVLDQQFGADQRKAEIAGAIGGAFEQLTEPYRKRRQENASHVASADLRAIYAQVENLEANRDLVRTQETLNTLNADAQKVLNQHLDAQQQADLMVKLSSWYNNFKSGQLSEEQIQTEVTKQILNQAQANGQRISNKVARSTADQLIRTMNQVSKTDMLDDMMRRGQLGRDWIFYSRMREFEDKSRQFELDTKFTKGNKLLRKYLGAPLGSSGVSDLALPVASALLLKGMAPKAATVRGFKSY